MVVVRSEEEFRRYLEMGYKPYLMKSQNRWYMRRGQDRPIIARELEWLALKTYNELRAKQPPPISAGQIQEMRQKGAFVEEIAEKTGLSRSGVYGVYEKEPEELVRPRRPTAEGGAYKAESNVKPIQAPVRQATEVNWFEETLSGLQRESEKWYRLIERAIIDLCQDPDFANKVSKIPATVAGLIALSLPLDEHIRNEIMKNLYFMWNPPTRKPN